MSLLLIHYFAPNKESNNQVWHYFHQDNIPMQYHASSHGFRNVIFQLIIFDIFVSFAPNIDCGTC